jgi:uncharacterized protein YqkB
MKQSSLLLTLNCVGNIIRRYLGATSLGSLKKAPNTFLSITETTFQFYFLRDLIAIKYSIKNNSILMKSTASIYKPLKLYSENSIYFF